MNNLVSKADKALTVTKIQNPAQIMPIKKNIRKITLTKMIRQYLILISFICTLASCDTDNVLINKETKDVEYFHATVDALNIPDSLSVLDSLRIGFFGTLGPDLCYSVSHYEVNPINEGISIKIIGKHILNSACLQAIAGYCETYNVLVEKPGYYKIKLINPENTFLLDSVRIY